MADDSGNATSRHRGTLGTRQTPIAGRNLMLTATREVAAAASAGTVYTFFRVPTRARIFGGTSKAYWDDLASTGAPTLDFGIKAVGGNITTDADAFRADADAATAGTGVSLISDIANYGKQVWEFSSATSDPGGMVDITVSILDAATNTGGTITLELHIGTDE